MARRRLAACAALALAACAPETADVADELPGRSLLARVEAQLEPALPALAATDLGHYALVHPVAPDALRTFMRQIHLYGERDALVPGSAYAVESHGGGVLALLYETWRPHGRAPGPQDAFDFESRGEAVPLAALAASHRRQVFLPVPGRAPEALAGELPDTPQLPRLRYGLPAHAAVEVDAWRFLSWLARHEPDLARPWSNALGQTLSAELLLEHARRHYLATRDAPVAPADHSSLHGVELLLAASAREGSDPEEIQQRFLRVELARRDYAARDRAELLGHHAESLGRLLADPRVCWSGQEPAQARAWLAWLEAEGLPETAGVAARHLTHLALGLRLVRDHGERLRADPAQDPACARAAEAG
jgi:hypothetical protein